MPSPKPHRRNPVASGARRSHGAAAAAESASPGGFGLGKAPEIPMDSPMYVDIDIDMIDI